jgi:predicted nucleic acid-binding protein
VPFVKSKLFNIVQVAAIPEEVARFQLGRGELSVITLGLQTKGATVILDDLAARRAAAILGLSIRGTLGLAVEARRRGIIKLLKPVVDDLQRSGLYLSPMLVQAALQAVGE